MRLLHVYSGNLYGGIESMLCEIARHDGGITHEFALCFDGRLAAELKGCGATVHRLGAVRTSRPASLRAARRALSGCLESGGYHAAVCHAPWSHALFGSVIRRAGVPLVFWAHDAATGRHWIERLARRVTPRLAVCNSSYTAGKLPALFPSVPAVVVHPPVKRPGAPIAGDVRVAIRSSLATLDAATAIVTACRSEAWKGHALLIDALARLQELDWVWWQIGGAQRPAEAGYLASLREAVAAAGIGHRVRWMGERSDVAQLLGAADLYCQPNLRPEPFGVAFVEALAAGLPVVTTALGGVAEIVDGSCGVLVPPADPVALAGALRTVIADRSARQRLAAAAPARARQVADPATELSRLESALRVLAPAEAVA